MRSSPKPDDYTRQVYATVPPDRWRRIIEQLAHQAEQGNIQAIRALMPFFKKSYAAPAGQLRLDWKVWNNGHSLLSVRHPSQNGLEGIGLICEQSGINTGWVDNTSETGIIGTYY